MAAQAQPPATGKQWEYYTDMPVGEILRRARLHYAQSLTDVESVLRIRAAQLGALEDGKHSELPGRVYAIGFVRAYSEYLGLDGDKMVHLFKLQSVGNKARPELNFPVAASESKLPGWFLLALSFAAVIGIVILFSLFHTSGTRSAQEEIPAVSSQLKAEATAPVPSSLPATVPAAPVTAASATTPAAAAVAAAAASGKPASRLVINVKDTTWVEIRNSSGKPLISQVLNPGEQYLVPNEDGLILATGNIGGLEFVVDGLAVAPLGNKGDVARGIKLDPDLLKPKGAMLVAAPVSAAATAPAAPAWKTAIHANAGQTPATAPPAQTAPAQPAPKPRKRTRSSDDAYKPSGLPGAASGSTAGGDPYGSYGNGAYNPDE